MSGHRLGERWCYELTMPTGTAITYDIMRATNSVGATVEGNAANDPYGDEGWPDCEFIASVWAENDPEGRARLIAAAPDLLEALKDAKEQLEAYHLEQYGEDYNSPSINAAIAKAEPSHEGG